MNGAERAHEFFDAVQDGDRATLDRMCTPDAVVWHNYDRVDMPFETVAQGLSALQFTAHGYSDTGSKVEACLVEVEPRIARE
jgi:ketosteroid isomerase-like protein